MRETKASFPSGEVLTIWRMGRRGCEVGTKSSRLRMEHVSAAISISPSSPQLLKAGAMH